jgi:hypothetical protein
MGVDGMFDTRCGYCGKPMKTFAINKRGDMKTVYCSTACETNARYEKRFKVTKV